MKQDLALSVSGLAKSFRRDRVLDDIYLDVSKGEVVAVIGPSGCGKSTLLRCLTWLEQPDQGFIEVDGKPFGRALTGDTVRHQSRRAIDAMRPRIGMVFQQLNLWPHMSVRENIVRPQMVVLRRTREAAEARAAAQLAGLGLADLAERYPYALSGGQKQRVAIARALAMDPALMLFDEPTSALDPELIGEVLALLRDLAATGMTMIVVTHEIGFARQVADRIVFMDAGRIVEDGPARKVLDSPSDPRLASFLSLIQRSPPAG
ncbi:amino acid ABC transporter ATP-binding protein [Aurantimonas endophytica]|uniref:Polar amino acid transport system ATP-binding protein n=1 Tax=Aurantimonas endophytica TaxID=1522175 RepID=A0A7W6MQ61_9HYPH|nr:amino acid ABC transporter ATP-binding protein [Aurantimonas endophytica]MBB4003648.1 polar amino acid transport system ATP-binding protein [Aurantimonas endophytica]MCO6404506.1 ATP-binding cassette domain-containing protein [Aurantimonas endophytica]